MPHCHEHGRHRRGFRFEMGPRGFGFGPGGFHFDFGDGPEGWGGPRGKRRGRRVFDGGELRLVLLKLIADEPRHGYELIKAIEEMTGGDYAPSPGVVYPTLSMLEDIGFIDEADSEEAKRTFEATDKGREHLAENAEEVEALLDRLAGMGKRRGEQRPEIGRAIGNMMHALKNRVARDGWNDELLNDVVDILDEAAKKIERA